MRMLRARGWAFSKCEMVMAPESVVVIIYTKREREPLRLFLFEISYKVYTKLRIPKQNKITKDLKINSYL